MSIPQKNYTYLSFVRTIVLVGISLFCSVLIWNRTIRNPSILDWNSWAFYEWLVNYEGGFVRRGLVGALMHTFYYENELRAINFLVGSSAILFVGLATAFALFNIKKMRSVILFSFCPVGLYWTAVGNEYFYRKEIFFYIAIFFCCLGYQHWTKKPNKFVSLALTTFILLASALLPLVHESFIFFCGLVFSLILFSLHFKNRTIQYRTVIGYVTFIVLAFVLITSYKGDSATSATIWQSLSNSVKSISDDTGPRGGIVAIGWTLAEGFRLSSVAILNGMASYYLFPLALVYLVLGFIVAEKRSINLKNLYLSKEFALPFLLITLTFVPLFFAGWDWGRWIMGIWCVALCIFMLDLDLPLRNIACYLPQPKIKRVVPSFFVLLLCIVLLTRVPECCISGSGNSLLSNPTIVSIKAAIKKSID